MFRENSLDHHATNGAPGLTTSNKKLLGAPGIATNGARTLLGTKGIATYVRRNRCFVFLRSLLVTSKALVANVAMHLFLVANLV